MKSYLITAGFLLATVAGPTQVNKKFKLSHSTKTNTTKASKPTIDHILLLNKSAKHMDTQTLDNSIRYLKNRLENFEKSDVIHYYNKGTVISIPRRILACLKSINHTQIQLAVDLLEAIGASYGVTQVDCSFTKRGLSSSLGGAQFDKIDQSVNKLIQISNSNKALIAC